MKNEKLQQRSTIWAAAPDVKNAMKVTWFYFTPLSFLPRSGDGSLESLILHAGIPISGNQQARFPVHGKIEFWLAQHSRQNNDLHIWHAMCFQFGGAGNYH
jgi:hypothetical protein